MILMMKQFVSTVGHEMYYRFKRYASNIKRFIKTPYWWYQRARYGYADCDWWSGDWYLAGIIAGIMERIVKDGHGVATSYADDWDTPVEVMVERRDEEWNKYIAIFREYSLHGPALNQEWKDDFGGVLDEDMQDALQWLSQHFQELWD